ncbi:MAG: 3,5-cyclic-nucleotide phosphodiesterase [Microbacteriaceae bacterium]|nr:3,5-cyclic-nucleotide phosphodiesterase [Microbacteriaceae bacterium]
MPRYRLAHLSDTHLTSDGDELLHRVVDADGHLTRLLDALERSGATLDAIVVSGDLTNRGETPAYRRLRDLVEPVAERLGARIIWAPGNHDDRAAMRRALFDEGVGDARVGDDRSGDDRSGDERSGADPLYSVVWVGDLRVIVLDTSVPGHHHGAIDAGQLDALRRELQTRAPMGSVLVMHHPPLPSILDLAGAVELRGQKQLAAVIQGTDVRSILAGHVHYSSSGTFTGIPVSTVTSTAYTQDLNVPVGGTRGMDGAQAFNLVYVYDDTILHAVVPVGAYPTVGEYVDAEESQRRLTAAGILRASSHDE